MGPIPQTSEQSLEDSGSLRAGDQCLLLGAETLSEDLTLLDELARSQSPTLQGSMRGIWRGWFHVLEAE